MSFDPLSGLFDLGASAFSYLGTSQTNDANRQIAMDTNAYNAYQAQSTRDFQERMSNTAYQRAVPDMLAAGINPMLLAAKGMGGASSPSGATAVGTTGAPMQNSIGNAVSTALDAAKTYADVTNTNADTALKVADLPGREGMGQLEASGAGKALRILDRVNPIVNSGFDLLNKGKNFLFPSKEKRRPLVLTVHGPGVYHSASGLRNRP